MKTGYCFLTSHLMSFSLFIAVAESCVLEFWQSVRAVFKSLPLRKTFSVNPVFEDHQCTAMMFPQLSFPVFFVSCYRLQLIISCIDRAQGKNCCHQPKGPS